MYLYLIYYCILYVFVHISARLSHHQKEPDTSEETFMETETPFSFECVKANILRHNSEI